MSMNGHGCKRANNGTQALKYLSRRGTTWRESRTKNAKVFTKEQKKGHTAIAMATNEFHPSHPFVIKLQLHWLMHEMYDLFIFTFSSSDVSHYDALISCPWPLCFHLTAGLAILLFYNWLIGYVLCTKIILYVNNSLDVIGESMTLSCYMFLLSSGANETTLMFLFQLPIPLKVMYAMLDQGPAHCVVLSGAVQSLYPRGHYRTNLNRLVIHRIHSYVIMQ